MEMSQLDASGASACCCTGVSAVQEGPETAVLTGAAIEALPVTGVLAGVTGLRSCEKPLGDQTSKAMNTSTNDNWRCAEVELLNARFINCGR